MIGALRIEHHVRPGAEAEFELDLNAMSQAASGYDGYLGTDMLRPQDGATGHRGWQILLRFETAGQLDAWRRSDDAAAGRAKIDALTTNPPEFETLRGIEPWFSVPEGHVDRAPATWKMAILTAVVLYPLVLVVEWLLSPLASRLPSWMMTMVLVTVLVALLTWVIMPPATKAMSFWLYPAKRRPESGA